MTHPLVNEIHCRAWLQELSQRLGTATPLGSIPDDEIAAWQDAGFTHVWLMGVWPTGPLSRNRSLESAGLCEELDRVVPGWKREHVEGSPFAVADYRVPRAFGGDTGLKRFRDQLRTHGMGLILDFVPNHVGLDHPWLSEHPEFFVQSPTPAPGTFEHQSAAGTTWIAHGKDPNFPPWIDTAQLDFRRIDTQRAVADAFISVAKRCDGIRCDMAMLLLSDVFRSHWEAFPPAEPTTDGEFWANLIRHVNPRFPDLLLIAEVYWDLEARLQELGFHYTYDKRLYDYLLARDRGRVRQHLDCVGPKFIAASAHFLENHDEPRVNRLLSLEEHRAAALLVLALPGLRLLQEGQLQGARQRWPVQLTHRPPEEPDSEVAAFYPELLQALKQTAVGRGRPFLSPNRPAWPGNPTDQDIVAVQWQESPASFDLAVVNLAPHRAQCYAELNVPELSHRNWRFQDLLGAESYQRYGDDLQTQGLYLDVPPHAAQLFHFTPID